MSSDTGNLRDTQDGLESANQQPNAAIDSGIPTNAIQDAPNEERPPNQAETKTTSPRRFRIPTFAQRSHSDQQQSKSTNPVSPARGPDHGDRPRVTFEASRSNSLPLSPAARHGSRSASRRRSSIDPRLRPEEDIYLDSRAATRREYQRRGTTLQQYYKEHPTHLPQLPFTFRYGFKRWKLALLIVFMVFDACIVPIILYYAMTFGGHVEGYITFAVVTAIWGGPAYFEFAVRSWRLILKERFFRPLGVTSRWAFDITNWIFVASITATTALLIVGAAPHIVWLRVLSLPGPALLLVIGACIGFITLFSLAGWKAPFRISSTPKGDKVHPGVFYIVEDVIAVNAGGGLPFREGWAARYEASPIFRKMIRDQSLFWSIGATVMGIVLIVIVCVHTTPKAVMYGVGWATPFVWAAVWALVSIPWVRYELHRESRTWESITSDRIEKGELDAEEPTPTESQTNGNTA
ncbi:MAG: hypothetical protein M1820_007802 [Bogoriella megaspora]|nr:MAG: hypothetical protein M1820_007802 [Bogoriella megaspora]